MEYPKQQPKREWFEQIARPAPFNDAQLNFFTKLGIDQVERIANFGCWCEVDDFWEDNPVFSGGVEPFNLLWVFDASEIVVLDKEAQHIKAFQRKLAAWQQANPESLWGRSISTIVADMTSPTIPDLPTEYFDLAYCFNVLYYMNAGGSDNEQVNAAISTMKRAVRPGGYVLVVEPKMGIGEAKSSYPPNANGHRVISECFEQAGLQQESLPFPYEADYIYLYKKLGD